MTRDEYLMTLKGCIDSLSEEEKTEALRYYIDYFEESGDDVNVMRELGSPQEVAAIVMEHFSKNKELNSYNYAEYEQKQLNSTVVIDSSALYYEFTDVKNIDFNFGAAEVVAISGDRFSVESRGISVSSLNCILTKEGTLYINNDKKINLNWFNHDRVSSIVPRILVTIPENYELENMKIFVGAGSFNAKNIKLRCKNGNISVGAGVFTAKGLEAHKINMRCGIGSVRYEGIITGISNIDCGMGAVRLILKGSPSDYSCDSKLGLGEVKFNDDKKIGVGQYYAESRKENHFSINCGMGSVNISIS